MANASVRAASAPQKILLEIAAGTDAELITNCGDVSLVHVSIIDASGYIHPLASHNITFTVTANAVIFGTGNGNQRAT